MVVVLNIRSSVIAVGVIFSTLTPGRVGLAQTAAGSDRPLSFETRGQLEARAKTAEAKQDTREAYLIRSRLEHGDFRVGDRIVIRHIPGPGGSIDTLTVRAGKTLQLPQVGDLSLDGVLRSELGPKITAHLSKYLRDPAIAASQLQRVGILGNVVKPGFYYVSPDAPLSDVLMGAGGPTPSADLEKISVRRDGEVIIDEPNTRRALTGGYSMDLLHMVAGDEIFVGKQRQTPWGMILPIATTILGFVIAYGAR